MQPTPQGIHEIVAQSHVTRERIREVIKAFYARIRLHPDLGPVFASIVPDSRWDAHVEKVMTFWLTCFGIERSYSAKAFMPAHLRHAGIRLEHIPQWLDTFESTLQELCSPGEAAAFRALALAMIENLAIGLARRDAPVRTESSTG